jgi:undecaprenyl-diphosphatase
MPEWLAVIILGIIEGITEFIPVSSTGHLLLAQKWVPHQSDLFNIVIQSAAVLAVLPLFRVRLQQVILEWQKPEVMSLIFKVMVAFVITAVGGVLLDKGGFKLEDNPKPIAIALLVGGIGFILVERWLGKTKRFTDEVTWTVAIVVGVAQLLAAIFPGASRSGTTILLALCLGLTRPAATEFSFLVGIPTMLAAGGYKIFKALFKAKEGAPVEDWSMVALGSLVSMIVSFIAVKWLLAYVRSNTFTSFGWYRIGLGVLILIIFL